jgi:hypothetical protein
MQFLAVFKEQVDIAAYFELYQIALTFYKGHLT